jgi:hypothetical protein
MEQQVLEYSRGTRDERSARRGVTLSMATFGSTALAVGLFVLWRWTRWEPAAVACLALVPVALVTATIACYYAPRTRLARGAVLAGVVLAATVGVDVVTPDHSHPREPANRVKCASNLRQIGQGILLYSNDNGVYPPTLGLLISTADINSEVMNCPSSDETRAPGTQPTDMAKALDANPAMHSSYVYVGASLNIKSPAGCVLAYERRHTHHKERGMNVLYNDGSVNWVDEKEAKHIEAELAAGQNPPRARKP